MLQDETVRPLNIISTIDGSKRDDEPSDKQMRVHETELLITVS